MRILLLTALYFIHLPLMASPIREPGSGTIEFINHNTAVFNTTALHLRSHADVSISGMVASVTLQQQFKNNTDQWQEGRYVFPLLETAAVTHMEMHIGERLIKGVVKEKQQAQKIYQEAKAAGKKAGLLQQHRPNIFSQSITNIGPQETIEIRLTYVQPLHYERGQFHWYLPMTMTPRYIPGTIRRHPSEETNGEVTINANGWGWAQPTFAVPDANLITPPHIKKTTEDMINPITLSIQLNAGLPLATIQSAYHPITINKQQGQHHIELAAGETSMDRDFVLHWQPVPQAEPMAALFSETHNGDDYALLMLMPPQHHTAETRIPRDTLFIIDTSGSMGGTSIRQAKSALALALEQLHPQDRFNIIEFNSHWSALSQQPIEATSQHIENAQRFVTRLKAGGGTEILPALAAALQQQKSEHHLRQIIFITDGSVGNEAQIFNYLNQHLHDSRLFTVGIGSAPNHFFMRKAATLGRGSFTTIGDLSEVQQQIERLLTKIEQPVMQDIAISDHLGRPLEIYPNPLPDLYAGEPIVALIRKDYEAKQWHVTGKYNHQLWQQSVTISGNNHPGIVKLWARKKIEYLLDQTILGVDKNTIRQQVLDVALPHQLLSPYTSFIAIEEHSSRPSDQTFDKTAIPNAIPAGQTLQTVNYPQTATSLWLNLLIGGLACMVLIAIKKPAIHRRSRFL